MRSDTSARFKSTVQRRCPIEDACSAETKTLRASSGSRSVADAVTEALADGFQADGLFWRVLSVRQATVALFNSLSCGVVASTEAISVVCANRSSEIFIGHQLQTGLRWIRRRFAIRAE